MASENLYSLSSLRVRVAFTIETLVTLSQQTASGPSQLQLSHLLPPALHDHLLPLTLLVGVVEGGEQGQDGRSLLHPQ